MHGNGEPGPVYAEDPSFTLFILSQHEGPVEIGCTQELCNLSGRGFQKNLLFLSCLLNPPIDEDGDVIAKEVGFLKVVSDAQGRQIKEA